MFGTYYFYLLGKCGTVLSPGCEQLMGPQRAFQWASAYMLFTHSQGFPLPGVANPMELTPPVKQLHSLLNQVASTGSELVVGEMAMLDYASENAQTHQHYLVTY